MTQELLTIYFYHKDAPYKELEQFESLPYNLRYEEHGKIVDFLIKEYDNRDRVIIKIKESKGDTLYKNKYIKTELKRRHLIEEGYTPCIEPFKHSDIPLKKRSLNEYLIELTKKE